MNKIKTWLFCVAPLFIYLFTSALTVSANDKKFPSDIPYTDIESTIQQYVEQNEETTAGLAIGIFDQNEIVFEDYFGYINIENELLVSADAVFEWGSVTKLLIWVSVMQQWEQGNIDLEENIENYLPENFLDFLEYDEPITMKHLMSHQAGFQDYIHDLFTTNSDEIESLGDELSKIKMKQIYPPGEYTAYSNYGSALAAYIVEIVSQQDFTSYVHQNIFEPLQLNNTSLSVDLTDNNYVKEHIQGYAGYDSEGNFIDDARFSIPLYPAGYAIGTLTDFMKFAQALVPINQTESKLFQHSNALTKMFEPLTTLDYEGLTINAHGLWGNYYQVPTLGHSGNTTQSSATIEFNPELGIGMVVMTNQANELKYNAEMYELIFGAFDQSIFKENPREVPKGVYRSARNIIQGPLSLYKMLAFTTYNETDLNLYWQNSFTGHRKYVLHPYTDYYQMTIFEIVGEFGIIILWVLAVLFSVLVLVGDGFIRPLIRTINSKMKMQEINRGKLKRIYFAGAILQVVLFLNILLLIYNVLTYQSSNQYRWQFIVNGIIALLLMGTFIFIVKNKSYFNQLEHGKWKVVLSTLFSFVSILFILYFQLYQFWGL
jgi:CubicO group peptidase (beta-lactamase class C family)